MIVGSWCAIQLDVEQESGVVYGSSIPAAQVVHQQRPQSILHMSIWHDMV
jgi:hypothetical protein